MLTWQSCALLVDMDFDDVFFPLLYSNIPEFSKYIQKLPSLEKIQKQQAAQQQNSVTAATEEKTKPTVGTSTRSTQDDNNV